MNSEFKKSHLIHWLYYQVYGAEKLKHKYRQVTLRVLSSRSLGLTAEGDEKEEAA